MKKNSLYSIVDISKVIVFDFDGIVLESAGIKDEAYFELFSDLPIDKRISALKYHVLTPGVNRRKKIKKMMQLFLNYPVTGRSVDFYCNRYAELVACKLENCSVVDGFLDFCEVFKAKPIYVASAAPESEVIEISKKKDLFLLFKKIYGSPDNKVNILNKIIYEESIEPKDLVFIGDRESDFAVSATTSVHFLGRNVYGSLDGVCCMKFESFFDLK